MKILYLIFFFLYMTCLPSIMLYECRQEDKSVIKHQLARLEARAKEGTFLRLIYQTEIRFFCNTTLLQNSETKQIK